MPSTTRYRRGDIVLTRFPFTDLTGSKRRPALVVSPNIFNRRMQDLVLVAVTSHLTQDGELTINDQDCVGRKLPKKSIVRPTKVFTIHSTLVVKRICALRHGKLDEVLKTLRDFFS